jgi:NAD(P)-dependent dehydrogenase (short-subunit alcohol dehydrogenase family)
MSKSRFAGRVVLVTGGAQGMGAAMADAFVAEGARIAVLDRDAEALAMTGERLMAVAPGRFRAHVGDVTRREDIRAAFDATRAEWGELDVVVAQAGVAGVVPLDEIDDDAWTRLVDVNLRGVFLTVQEGARAMRDGGAIVVTCSTNAFYPEANTAHYTATKGGVRAFAKAVALDLAPRKIRVNVVHPGIIRTRLWPFADDPAAGAEYLKGVPLARFGETADVAKAVLFLASDDASYITGADLVVDGGVTIGVHLGIDERELDSGTPDFQPAKEVT